MCSEFISQYNSPKQFNQEEIKLSIFWGGLFQVSIKKKKKTNKKIPQTYFFSNLQSLVKLKEVILGTPVNV